MDIALIPFGLGAPAIIRASAFGVVGLLRHRAARAIFADRDRIVWVLAVIEVQIGRLGLRASIVPAIIAVSAEDVGYACDDGRFGARQLCAILATGRQGCWAAGVFGFGERVQRFQQRARVRGLARVLAEVDPDRHAEVHFVGDAPHRHRRVVDVLANEFGQLLAGVLHQSLAWRHLARAQSPFRHQRNFVPQDKAIPVRQIVDVLALLIVGEADGVGAHFADQGHILVFIGAGKRPALAFLVLVARDPVQGHVASIEEKALFRIDANIAKARGLVNPVDHAAARRAQRAYQVIEIRVLHPLPQVRMVEVQALDGLHACARRHPDGIGDGGDHRAGGVHKPGLQDALERRCAIIGEAGADVNRGGLSCYFFIGRIDPRSAMIQHVKVDGGGGDQADGTIKSAMDKEVSGQRQGVGGGVCGRGNRIVHLDHQKIVLAPMHRA